MLLKIAKYIFPIALVSITTIAKADVYDFPFTYTTTGSGANITASGYFVTQGYSSPTSSLPLNSITSWNITFTSPSFLGASFILNPFDSNLSVGADTLLYASPDPNDLIFQALDLGGGFDLYGIELLGQDQDQVEWRWVDGAPSSTITVTNLQSSIDIVGSDPLDNYPVAFETADNNDLGSSPTPTPEPSSLLLFGTGSISLVLAGARKLSRGRRKQETIS
jgi:hypothetical protein